MSKKRIEKFLEHYRHGNSIIRQILPQKKKLRNVTQRTRPRIVKGVYNGNFYRFKIPEEGNSFPNLPRFPTILPVPKGFHRPKVSLEAIVPELGHDKSFHQKIWNWLVDNWPTLLLNAGSLCTLLAFTRSDVIELRTLSATGSICNATFRMTQKPFMWIDVAWPSIFASVNGFKIMEILHERNANVHMSEEQEHNYCEFFLPHGVTPKQFERIEQAATVLHFRKGEAIVSKGDKLNYVYLVVNGSTQAHIKGRHLTAQSTSERTKGDLKLGGDSGSWVGEMRFLERYWERQQQQTNPKRNTKHQVATTVTKDNDRKDAIEIVDQPPTILYSVRAKEDCVVWAWSYDEMANLVSSSTDMRGALTRAMTSAVVGKVVNMTVSRRNAMPNWSTWLSDWSREDGAKVDVRGIDTVLDENLPGGPTDDLDDDDLEPNPVLQ